VVPRSIPSRGPVAHSADAPADADHTSGMPQCTLMPHHSTSATEIATQVSTNAIGAAV
jgi:hypothetical protein